MEIKEKEKETGWSIFTDILMAFGIMIVIGTILSGIVCFIKSANASELEWIPDYPTAWVGAEYDISSTKVTCHQNGFGWNGNVGVRQPIVDYGPARMNGVVQHHSCAFSSDAIDYNAVGINLEFNFGKLFK